MGISEAIERLQKYFSWDEAKRKKKIEKIEKIVLKLRTKKKELRKKIKETNSRQEKELLQIELDAIVKLLKKSKTILEENS